MDNIDELIKNLEQAKEPELRWNMDVQANKISSYIGPGDVPDELSQKAAACIRQLQKENAAKDFMLKRLMESWNKERASLQDDNHQLRQQNAESAKALKLAWIISRETKLADIFIKKEKE